jgi:hypothetical protein
MKYGTAMPSDVTGSGGNEELSAKSFCPTLLDIYFASYYAPLYNHIILFDIN